MIIKIISTQTIDLKNYPENNGRPFILVNTKEMTETYLKSYLKYLKINASAGLLKYKIIEV